MAAKRRGFTLLELLVVMALIAILSGIGTTGYRLAQRKTKEGRAKADLEKLCTALEEFRIEFGQYPPQTPGAAFAQLPRLGELTNAVAGLSLTDPWGRAYHYECRHRFRYRIWSKGADESSASDNIEPTQPGY